MIVENTYFDGSVSVSSDFSCGGDASVSGNLTVGHDLKVGGWIRAENISGVDLSAYRGLSAYELYKSLLEDGAEADDLQTWLSSLWVANILFVTSNDTIPQDVTNVSYLVLEGEYSNFNPGDSDPIQIDSPFDIVQYDATTGKWVKKNVMRGIDTIVTESSANLITSGAVKAAIDGIDMASASRDGLMSKQDKARLDGIPDIRVESDPQGASHSTLIITTGDGEEQKFKLEKIS